MDAGRYTKLLTEIGRRNFDRIERLSTILWTFYNQEGRYYHTLEHIEECLEEFDEIRHLCKNPVAVEVALWYHDVVYTTAFDTNEEMSIEKAVSDLTSIESQESYLVSVPELIAATVHNARATSEDARYVADIDLCIFAKSRDRVLEYEKQIHLEYAHEAVAYLKKRIEILKAFDRKRIYHTGHFYKKYETLAHANLKFLIQHITVPM